MSNALDDIAPSFYAAKCRWPDAPNIQAHYADLATTFEENGSSLLELSKSFLEMVCITVVNELGGNLPASSTPTTTELLACALDVLGLRNERGASQLSKIISAFNKIADGLSEVRNHEGSVSHGKDGFLDVMSDQNVRVYLLSTDAIISLILARYDGVDPSIMHTREGHDRYKHHNAKINAGAAVNAEIDEDGMLVLNFQAGALRKDEGPELRVPVSKLLYNLDRQAYVDVLDALQGAVQPGVEEEILYKMPSLLPTTEKAASPHFEALTEYSGWYVELVNPLYEHIVHSLLDGNDTQAVLIKNLTYTLLNGMENLGVVDWSTRDSTRSAVRVFVKRLLSLYAIEGLGSEAVEGIVNWLAGKIDGGGA